MELQGMTVFFPEDQVFKEIEKELNYGYNISGNYAIESVWLAKGPAFNAVAVSITPKPEKE